MTPEAIANQVGNLVSLPRAYHRINEMLGDDRYGAADVARVISHEPALTARLLRMVNSAYYGLPSRIDTVPLAITVLGTRALHELVLATSVASAFERINAELVDVADFWHHSLYCGISARLLSKRLRQGESEQVFIAGLLHDLGKLAIYHEMPDRAAEALDAFERSERPLYEIEEEVLGFTHAEVGKALLRHWELPGIYQEVVAHHHHPDRSKDYQLETCLVHVADALSKKVEPGHKLRTDGSDVPIVHPVAQQKVPLDADTVADLRIDADVMAIEVYGTLFGS